MPRGQFDALELGLADGERVHVFGRPELYEQRGELRLKALTIERFGLGAHLAALERLKRKLAAEGLFDESRKRALPRFPRLIGLVTGNDAAAKRDVLTHIVQRFPPANVARRGDVRPGPARCRGDRDRDRRPLRPRRRRDRARARRRQLRGPASVLRRARRPRGRRMRGAARLGSRPRAGHTAVRPRRRRARLHAHRRRATRRPRPRRAARRGSSARATRCTAAPSAPPSATRNGSRRAATACSARRCSHSSAAARVSTPCRRGSAR